MSTELVSQKSLQYAAWTKLADAKNNLTNDLTKRELALQGLLLNVPDDAIATKLAEYRKQHAEMVDARKKFTGIITDKLITPLMEWEKRTDPKVSSTYLSLSARELELRKEAANKAKKDQDIVTERGKFKAHFQNQYMELATKYRHALAGIATQAYVDCLTAKTPVDQVSGAIAVAEKAMGDVKPGSPEKFNRVHLTPEDAAAMYKQLQPPSWADILSEAKANMREKFSMYAHDLAAGAAEDVKREFEATIVEEVQDLKQEQAANVLMASAESFIISDAKGVKESKHIVIEDNSEAWVVKIISAFLANFGTAFAKTRNKKYSSLTVAQMAAALDAAGIEVKGVEYKIVEK